MPRYLFIITGGEPSDPTAHRKYINAYGRFMEILHHGNHFLSAIPSMSDRVYMVDSQGMHKKGDFSRPENAISGVMEVSAENIHEACRLAAWNPAVTNNGRVIIHQIWEVEQQQ